MTAPSTQSRIAAMHAFFDRLAAADYDAFFALWAETPAFEMPFPAPGLIDRYPSADGVRRFFTTFRGALAEAAWRIDRVVAAEGEDLLVAEGRGECVTRTGKRYDNRYIWVMAFDDEAKLTLVREYSDPAVITRSFGGAEVLGPAFGNLGDAT